MSTNKGSPNEYSIGNLKGKRIAVHCPTIELWDTTVKLIPNCRLINSDWNTHYKAQSSFTVDEYGGSYADKPWYEKNGYQIITAEQFLSANGQLLGIPERGYKVGSWITVLDSGCRVGDGFRGSMLEGNAYQIAKIEHQSTDKWKFVLENMPVGTRAISWDKSTMADKEDKYIRASTAVEIASAQQKVCPVGKDNKGNKDNKGKWWVTTDGIKVYAGTRVWWLNQDEKTHNTTTEMTDSYQGSINSGYKMFSSKEAAEAHIQRKLGNIGWQVGDVLTEEYLNSRDSYRKRDMVNVCNTRDYKGDRKVLQVVNGWAEVSGTASLWLPPKQGHTVQVGEKMIGWKPGDEVNYKGIGNTWMILTGEKEGIYKVRVKGEKTPNVEGYTIENINGYIASGNWVIQSTSNSTVVSNKEVETKSISSSIKIKTNVNTEQKVRYTGTIICSIVSQIRQPEDRRKGGISGGNCQSLIGTGNQ